MEESEVLLELASLEGNVSILVELLLELVLLRKEFAASVCIFFILNILIFHNKILYL